MEKIKIIIYGAGFQGKIACRMLQADNHFSIIGFLDDDATKHGKDTCDLPVLGGMDWIIQNKKRNIRAFIAIGNNVVRLRLSHDIRGYGIKLLNCIHPSAIVMENTEIGTGVCVCAGAVIVTGTIIKNDVIINTGATIDHDSIIKEGAQIAPGVHTAGSVKIGIGSFIGVGAAIGPNISIGDGCIVGAGSVVLNDIPSSMLAYGVPAKVVRDISAGFDWQRLLSGD